MNVQPPETLLPSEAVQGLPEYDDSPLAVEPWDVPFVFVVACRRKSDEYRVVDVGYDAGPGVRRLGRHIGTASRDAAS